MELLHESRLDISNIDGKVYFFQAKPEIVEQPVLLPDTSIDGAGASIYGSVMYDAGRYRMWYQAWPVDWDGGDVNLVAYAESDDGVTWKKPDLGLVDYGGRVNNLCNLGFHSPSVFTDPADSGDFRYRATGYARPNRPGSAGVSLPGYYTAHSGDGFYWELDRADPQWQGADVITSMYHPEHHRAIVALKRYYRVNGVPRRSILHAAFADGEWSMAKSALVPDEFDDIVAATKGFVSGDYYGMGMMPAGRGTVGFLWQFRHRLPRTAERETGVFGLTDVTLVFQERPGDRWVHCPGRSDFISHDDVAWGPGGVYTSSGPVSVGDTQRLYFSGASRSHGWYLDDKWKLQEGLRDRLMESGIARIGYASWKTNRLFGFRSDPSGTVELHVPQPAGPFELRLNYRCSPEGRLSAESPEKSEYLVGDETDAPVRWHGSSVRSSNGKSMLTIRIVLDSAEIYGYELRPV